MIAKSTKQKNRYKGTAIIEAAIIFPLLIILTFGAIEYGWMFLKAHQITNAARNGCRIAIRPDATVAQIETKINALMAAADITGHVTTVSPGDVSVGNAGAAVEVSITVPWDNLAIMNISILPKPENIRASTTMAKEGFTLP